MLCVTVEVEVAVVARGGETETLEVWTVPDIGEWSILLAGTEKGEGLASVEMVSLDMVVEEGNHDKQKLGFKH